METQNPARQEPGLISSQFLMAVKMLGKSFFNFTPLKTTDLHADVQKYLASFIRPCEFYMKRDMCAFWQARHVTPDTPGEDTGSCCAAAHPLACTLVRSHELFTY